MRVSSSNARIRAITLGEASLNLIRMDQIPLRAKFALLDEEGNACGYFEKSNGWSEKVLEALQVLAGVIEEDAMSTIFLEETSSPTTSSTDEPPQF